MMIRYIMQSMEKMQMDGLIQEQELDIIIAS